MLSFSQKSCDRLGKFIAFGITFLLFFLFALPVHAQEDGEWDVYVTSEEEAKELNKYTRSKLNKNYDGWCGQYAHDIAATLDIISTRSASYNGKDWYWGYTKGAHRNILEEGWERRDGWDTFTWTVSGKDCESTMYIFLFLQNHAIQLFVCSMMIPQVHKFRQIAG